MRKKAIIGDLIVSKANRHDKMVVNTLNEEGVWCRDASHKDIIFSHGAYTIVEFAEATTNEEAKAKALELGFSVGDNVVILERPATYFGVINDTPMSNPIYCDKLTFPHVGVIKGLDLTPCHDGIGADIDGYGFSLTTALRANNIIQESWSKRPDFIVVTGACSDWTPENTVNKVIIWRQYTPGIKSVEGKTIFVNTEWRAATKEEVETPEYITVNMAGQNNSDHSEFEKPALKGAVLKVIRRDRSHGLKTGVPVYVCEGGHVVYAKNCEAYLKPVFKLGNELVIIREDRIEVAGESVFLNVAPLLFKVINRTHRYLTQCEDVAKVTPIMSLLISTDKGERTVRIKTEGSIDIGCIEDVTIEQITKLHDHLKE